MGPIVTAVCVILLRRCFGDRLNLPAFKLKLKEMFNNTFQLLPTLFPSGMHVESSAGGFGDKSIQQDGKQSVTGYDSIATGPEAVSRCRVCGAMIGNCI